MGFSTLNDYLNKVTNLGQIGQTVWQKLMPQVGVFTAGRWYNMGYHLGTPTLQRPGELLSNGQLGMDSTGWTLGGGWSWVAGTLQKSTGNTNTASITPIGSTVASTTYHLEYWMSAWSTANLVPSIGGTSYTSRGATGQYHEIKTSTNTTDLIFTPASTCTCTIQNISLRRLLKGVPMTSNDMGAQYMGSAVSPATKHLLSAGVVSAAANFVPGTWMLVDQLMAYPVDMNSASAQTLDNTEGLTNGTFTGSASSWTLGAGWTYNTNAVDKGAGTGNLSQTTVPAAVAGKVYNVTYTITNMTVGGSLTIGIGGATTTAAIANGTYTVFITALSTGDLIFTAPDASRFTIDTVSCTLALPRYSDGSGVRAMVVWDSGAWQAASNATSTAAHNISMTYTNSAGTSGKGMPISVAGLTGAVPVLSHINHSGVAANNIGPFLPLANGDAGIRNVQSFQLSATSGANNVATIILCKPLAILPNSTVSVATERDFMNQIRSLPQIQDGANLTWLFMAGAATAVNTAAYGWMDYCWG